MEDNYEKEMTRFEKILIIAFKIGVIAIFGTIVISFLAFIMGIFDAITYPY